MAKAAKARVFMNGRSQHVTIPAEFRFSTNEVYVQRDPQTGVVSLSESRCALRWPMFLECWMRPVRPTSFLSATSRSSGKSLALMDLLIASQAVATGAVLVSHDNAFRRLTSFLTVTDWATDI